MNCQFSILEDEALLHISGPDSLTFLQGQTTCDTQEVGGARATQGLYCTPQGRVVCDFLLLQLEDGHFAMRMRRDIREHAASVFGKYIVFSKAQLDATNDEWRVVAVWGEAAAATLEKALGVKPAARHEAVTAGSCIAVQLDDSGHAFECYGRDVEALLEVLSEAAQPCEESAWQRMQILAGIPRIEAATIEMFVPQVLNYDLTGHISFTKGCYTGQEVVARLHYRGKSKRRTFLAQPGEAAGAGDPVFSVDGAQSIGNVVNCAVGEPRLALVSATLEAPQLELHLHSAEGPPVSLSQPPYPLDTD